MRISAAIFAIGCFLAGYAASGYRVSASAEDVDVRRLPSGIHLRDTVTLSFAAGAMASGTNEIRCQIVETSGIWVRCANPDSGSSDSSREQVWYDTTRVAIVKKITR